MKLSTVVAPAGGRALLAAFAVAGCTGEISPGPGSGDGEMVPGTTTDDGAEPDDPESEVPGDEATNPCALGAPGVYSPFGERGGYPSGSVDTLPWSGIAETGATSAYPAGDEDFSGYGDALPELVECSDDKGRRSHVDVTAGCLEAVDLGSGYTRGLVSTDSHDYFRALALGYTPDDSLHPIKWTDQGIEYRFFHSGQTADGNTGFKAFARYRSEDDLYVASWRFDGVAQIQKKICGQYTALAANKEFGAPSPDVWHSIRFETVGDNLALYLDGELALTATSSSLSWGTTGIRIDSADGSYIDDWKVFQP